MSHATNKADRLAKIEAILLAHPEGLKKAEIARRLGVDRATVGRYLADLPAHIYPDDLDEGRWKIDRSQYLVHLRLNLHEAMSVHIAARMLTTRMDKKNPHAAAALRKLGVSLNTLAPRIAEHLKRSADVMDDEAQRYDTKYLEVLEKLTLAWAELRRVKLWHVGRDGAPRPYDFAVHFIEPYAVGQTTHVMGVHGPVNRRITFKLERIERIELQRATYTIPKDFDPSIALRDAWGIWTSDNEPVEVVLRFHPRVAQRVHESRWHRSEELDDQPDGYLLWRAQIAEPREMLPWIRGWGADVEVLGPARLRTELENETQRLMRLYGLLKAEPPLAFTLWAKTSRDRTQTHPLICHLVDVAQTALALWHTALPPGQRGEIAARLGLDEDAAGRTLAFWVGLHDIGKASPAFQRKYTPAVAPLTAGGLDFPPLFSKHPVWHATISAHVLPDLLEGQTALPFDLGLVLAQALGGHHGLWPTSIQVEDLKTNDVGGPAWDDVRRILFDALRDLLQPAQVSRFGSNRRETNAFLGWFSGFTTVADWIGSMEEHFPYVRPPLDLTAYAAGAADQAVTAMEKLGWTHWRSPTTQADFTPLFGFPPNEMQQAATAIAQKMTAPGLIIVESGTGGGKTEASLYMADHWAHRYGQRGLYVAMPTMATSNQMFGRVSRFFRKRYGDGAGAPLLVHSQARWLADAPPPEMELEDDERPEANIADQAWFLPRKRSLLTPFAVGTVDQTLLSVLTVRHFFVRLFGLSHKTVIFDEVHAYDLYMSTILERLLGWLAANKVGVIILSATLPSTLRTRLLSAYGDAESAPPPAVEYPAISWRDEFGCHTSALPPGERRTIQLEWRDRSLAALIEAITPVVAANGCVAVICNTVARAQEVFLALAELDLVPQEDLYLFHARYPFAWRQSIEHEVLAQFGKNGARRSPAIVVATQVIEQSLDLDFDFMVTDLAPIDLLIQRAGRLHRHDRPHRPASLQPPHFTICADLDSDGVPVLGTDAYVYAPYVLLRTHAVLAGRSSLATPADTAALIEAVYTETDAPPAASAAFLSALAQAQKALAKDEAHAIKEASSRLIPALEAESVLELPGLQLEEDDPKVHKALQAITRLAPPAISLVCVHRLAGGWSCDPADSATVVDLDTPPDSATAALLAQHTLSINRPQLVRYFLEQGKKPAAWQKHPLLRDHFLLHFDNGVWRTPGAPFWFTLDRRIGLTIHKEG